MARAVLKEQAYSKGITQKPLLCAISPTCCVDGDAHAVFKIDLTRQNSTSLPSKPGYTDVRSQSFCQRILNLL